MASPDRCAQCGEVITTRGVTTPVCSVHGDAWQWRECGYGELHRAGLRICKAVGDMLVCDRFCASCPVPDLAKKAALWDACGEKLVEAARAPTHEANDYNCQDWPIGQGCEGCKGDELRKAALAAVPEEKP